MQDQLNFKNRNIAILDLETTGLDPTKHEIIEMGLVVAKQPTLEIIDTFEAKIFPKHIDSADPKALALNGYNETEWITALSIEEALKIFVQKTAQCMLCAHNVSFDWSFIKCGLETYNIKHELDYHQLDTATMVWLRLSQTELERINLNKTAEFLGIQPEPQQHRALNGAMTCYKVLKKLKLG